MSAHHYFREFSYCDSGMIPWLQVAEAMSESGRPLSEMVEERIARYPVSGEINLTLGDPARALAAIRERRTQREALAVDETDGLSFEFAAWRFNVRIVEHRAGRAGERRDAGRQGTAAARRPRRCSTCWSSRSDGSAGAGRREDRAGQINPTVGDLKGNAALIVERARQARACGGRRRRLPRAGHLRLSAGGPAAQGPLPG